MLMSLVRRSHLIALWSGSVRTSIARTLPNIKTAKSVADAEARLAAFQQHFSADGSSSNGLSGTPQTEHDEISPAQPDTRIDRSSSPKLGLRIVICSNVLGRPGCR